MTRLDALDLKLKLSREEEAIRLAMCQTRLLQLRLTLGGLIGEQGIGPPLLVVFEGWDASGKGGAIKRLVAPLDPRHVRVKQFAAPTYDEKRHHWLYEEIRDFERTLAAEGTIVVKFWLHISAGEQLKRFNRRAKDPLRTWKLTDEDWRNRKKRRAYLRAVEDMLEETDTEFAPWTLIEGNSKRYARVKVVESVIAATEEGMRRNGMKLPPAL